MTMNIGDLKHRITFKTYTSIENDMGDAISSWIDYKTVWASVTNLHGRELFQAMQVQAEYTVKFTIRYCKNINENMRIVFNGQEYNITFVDDIKYKHTYMEIQALAVVNNATT